MKTILYTCGVLTIIGALGYLDRGFVDFLGLGALAMLLVPIVIALRSEADETERYNK